MLRATLAVTQRGDFNAPFALVAGLAIVLVGWSAFRNAEPTSDRIAAVLGFLRFRPVLVPGFGSAPLES